jgi:sensor histidine kinase YesM
VIGHLIQNAIEATTERGSVAVRVYADGPNAVVEVADDGVGMAPEFVRDQLFKPSRRPSRTAWDRQRELSVCHRPRRPMLADSTPGAGTSVRVLLPRLEAGAGGEVALREVA